MKHLIFTAIMIMATLACSAQQQVKQNSDGNYVAVATKSESKPTGKTFTDKDGKKYPVYITKTGKLFVMKRSKKTGKEYRAYLAIK